MCRQIRCRLQLIQLRRLPLVTLLLKRFHRPRRRRRRQNRKGADTKHETKADDGHSDFGQHYFTVYGLSDDIDCVDQAESAHYPDSFFWPDAREKVRLLTGFFCGLLTDIFFNSIIGFNALILSLGWVFSADIFIAFFYDDDINDIHCFLISISDLIYGIVQYGFMFLMRGRIHFFRYLGRVILPEVLYTLILTIVLYRLLYRINQKLSMTDGGGADSFV